MIMYTFKEHQFLELEDENGDVIGWNTIELLDHLIESYVQPEDVVEHITELYKELEQPCDPTEDHKCTSKQSRILDLPVCH